MKTKLSCETSIKISQWKMGKRSFRARHPSKSQSGRCGNEASVQDIHQNLKVEDVKTKLLCETSIKISKWKMWKRSFCARHPSKSQSGRCENEAFCARHSIKISKWKMWKRSSRARHPSKSQSGRCENEAFCARHPSKSQSGRCGNEAFVRDIHQNLKVEDVKTKLSCETSIKI